jgi:hypothetical protein
MLDIAMDAVMRSIDARTRIKLYPLVWILLSCCNHGIAIVQVHTRS